MTGATGWWIGAGISLAGSFIPLALNTSLRREIAVALKMAKRWSPEPPPHEATPERDLDEEPFNDKEFEAEEDDYRFHQDEAAAQGRREPPDDASPDWMSVEPPVARVPETMPTYSRTDIERFMRALSPELLESYADNVLARDMWFALLLGLATACCGIAITQQWPGQPLVLYLGALSSALGVIYGAADIGEDHLLRQIILRALPARRNEFPDPGNTRIDAAQVDAANALTRLKMVTLFLSVVGILAWLVMQVLAKALVAGSGNSQGGSDQNPPEIATAGSA